MLSKNDGLAQKTVAQKTALYELSELICIDSVLPPGTPPYALSVLLPLFFSVSIFFLIVPLSHAWDNTLGRSLVNIHAIPSLPCLPLWHYISAFYTAHSLDQGMHRQEIVDCRRKKLREIQMSKLKFIHRNTKVRLR